MQEIRTLSEEQIYEKLNTSPRGLTEEEAKKRLEKYGPNEIAEVKGRPLILKFLENFYHLFAILFWVASVMAFISEQPQLGYAIIGVIFINAIFSFSQEYKAEKATEALKKLMPVYAKVIRDGEHQKILAVKLVPGDLVILEEGDAISADGRVIENFELRTNDSALTGESHPRRKVSDPFLEENVTATDSPNLIFAGTSVVAGTGRSVVFATGMKSEFGKIAYLTQSVKDELSPLQKGLNKLVKLISAIAVIGGIVLFIPSLFFTSRPPAENFILVIGLIIANVPEGLLPTVTLGLALGVSRLAKKNALVKKLSSVETLGATNIICTDKTGTLTQNEMTVREMWISGQNVDVGGIGYEPSGKFFINGKEISKADIESKFNLLFKTGVLSNTAKLLPPNEEKNKWSILGDPTEAALIVAAEKGGFSAKSAYQEGFLAHQNPFESVRKRMSVIYRHPNKTVAYVKGAPFETINLCTKIFLDGKVQPLDKKTKKQIIQQNDDYAKKALRVLAFAVRELPEMKDYSVDKVETELTFVGLMAMMDPPREAVTDAVKQAHGAGIKIIMITGDYGLTADSIARKIGIIEKTSRIITGAELEKLSDEEVANAINNEEVIFARVSPEHKMRVVSVVKDQGYIVAVTGDGVNDAPALKMADIGVAMGIAGTDVAKEAAEMIITDDNFATIVHAIEEGRAVYDNIRKFIIYIFAHLTAEILPFLLFIFFGGTFFGTKFFIPLGLTVMLILAIDLGTDTFPAVALATEPAEPGVMQRPPRSQKEPIVTVPMLVKGYLFIGGIETILTTGAFFWALNKGGWYLGVNVATSSLLYLKVTTITFAGIVACQLGNVFAMRTTTASVFETGFFKNKWIVIGALFGLLFAGLVIYVPPFQSIFGTTSLDIGELLVILPFPFIIFFADELRKFILRRKGSKR